MRLPIKEIWNLGLPLSLGLVIQMIIVMVDSAFAGNLSYVNLAAVALGGGIYFILFLLLIGFIVGVSVKAGQAAGAEDKEGVINCFRQGAIISVAGGSLFAILLLQTTPLMLFLGQDPSVVALTETYLLWVAWTLPLQAIVVLIRDYFAVIDRPWKSVLPSFLTLILNAFLNYCLSTGNLGFPALGITGIAIASLISSFFLVALLCRGVGWHVVKQIFNFLHGNAWRNSGMTTILLVSFPIAMTLVMEEAFFSGSVLLTGTLGPAEQAAHQIVLNLIGTSFLFNTGFGIAVAIAVGKHIGAKEYGRVMPTVKAGWIVAQIFTIPFALILLFGDSLWVWLFLDPSVAGNQPTIGFVESVLLIAFVMLFVDTIWLIAIEALHGMLDTVYPAVSTLIAYWVVAAPVAYWTTQTSSHGFVWVWGAMFIGAVILTVMVTFRLRKKVTELVDLSTVSEQQI